MDIKEFLKPTILKTAIFLFIGFVYLYLAAESTCAVSLFFKVCYNAYGFPFQYLITGDIDNAQNIIKTLPFFGTFNKFENTLVNPAALTLNIILIYLLSSFISMIFENKKLKSWHSKAQ